jgi:hypothetical protein
VAGNETICDRSVLLHIYTKLAGRLVLVFGTTLLGQDQLAVSRDT